MWKEDIYHLQDCTKMNYLMCESATEILKTAEKNETVFDTADIVQTELINPMNKIFGCDVFGFKSRTETKYAKIHCIVGCGFDIWLKYSLT